MALRSLVVVLLLAVGMMRSSGWPADLAGQQLHDREAESQSTAQLPAKGDSDPRIDPTRQQTSETDRQNNQQTDQETAQQTDQPTETDTDEKSADQQTAPVTDQDTDSPGLYVNGTGLEIVDVSSAEQPESTRDLKSYVPEKSNRQERAADTKPFFSCVDVKQYDTDNGVHTLTVNGQNMTVYCDQVTDGGGWTVIQRRRDGSESFDRNWVAYEKGFGNLEGEFWLGLKYMHVLTSARKQLLRIDLFDYDGSVAFAKYNEFMIGGPDNYYRLYISGCTGNAGDSMVYSNNMPFTTKDEDHDVDMGNCAVAYSGAWWHKGGSYCTYSNLNGLYSSTKVSNNRDVTWYHWKNWYSLKFVEMKIRPY